MGVFFFPVFLKILEINPCFHTLPLSAFCRQDEIESKLLKIEGLITSLGKHLYAGDCFKMKVTGLVIRCEMQVLLTLCVVKVGLAAQGRTNTVSSLVS